MSAPKITVIAPPKRSAKLGELAPGVFFRAHETSHPFVVLSHSENHETIVSNLACEGGMTSRRYLDQQTVVIPLRLVEATFHEVST